MTTEFAAPASPRMFRGQPVDALRVVLYADEGDESSVVREMLDRLGIDYDITYHTLGHSSGRPVLWIDRVGARFAGADSIRRNFVEAVGVGY